jgi:hypothetical protein
MPGFLVGVTKGGAENRSLNLNDVSAEYYTNFFWDVNTVLEEVLNGQVKSAPLLALKDCKMPVFTVDEEKVMGSSIDYKFAKKVNWDPVSMSWYDNVGLLPFIKKWRDSIFTFKGGLALAADYKKNTMIYAYTSDGRRRQEHLLIQSFPTSLKFSDLSYTSSDIKSVELTLSYDYATMNET